MVIQAKTPLRVVQWATGNVGLRSLRAIIEHPAMELAGVYVHSPAKAGQDAGTLYGTTPAGILATTDKQALIALKPDCVLYMPPDCDYAEIAEILRAGSNIVTTKGEFQNPESMDPAIRAQIEAACREGQTSIHSAGSSPGFITDAIPLVLSTMQRRLDCITIDEFADISSRDSPEMLFDIMGFGRAPSAEAASRRAAGMVHSRRRSFDLLANAFGLPLDSIESGIEFGLAKNRTQIAAGIIEPGTVAGQRITVAGMRNGKPLLRFRANWYVTTDMDVDWKLMHSGWRILVEGDTPLDVSITFPVSLEDYPLMSPGLTAHPAVNAVPGTCAAAPGICTSLDLPLVAPVFG